MKRETRITVRRFSPDDCGKVFSFGRMHCGETEQWPLHWNADSVAAVLARGMECSYLAEVRGKVVGILLGEPTGRGNDLQVIEIRCIAVDHVDETDTIAAAMIEALEEGARARGINSIRASLSGESSLCRLMADNLGFSVRCALRTIEKKISE